MPVRLITSIENPGCIFRPIDTVFAHGVYGLSAAKDFFARIADFTGGRVKGYEQAGEEIIGSLVNKLRKDTEKVGGNAIVGLTINVIPLDAKGTSMYCVTVYGTAVELKE
jgi:uncharacterized protein YbjQ (UPF0145 family)